MARFGQRALAVALRVGSGDGRLLDVLVIVHGICPVWCFCLRSHFAPDASCLAYAVNVDCEWNR
jgi:hypothetical protein